MSLKSTAAIIISFCLHVILIILLVVNLNFSKDPKHVVMPEQKETPIKALVIDQVAVEKKVAQLKKEEQRKKNAEIQRIERLQQQEKQAKKKIAALDVKWAQEEKKRKQEIEEARKQLMQLKKQQETERKQAQALTKKKEEEKKHLAMLEQERKKIQAAKKKEALEQQMREEEKRLQVQQMAEEQKQLSATQEQQMLSEIEKYTVLISHSIGKHWIVPDNSNDDASCVLLIRLAPGGAVLSVKLVTTSGDGVLDRSATSAVYKASPLPVPSDPSLFEKFREIRLRVKPEGYLL